MNYDYDGDNAYDVGYLGSEDVVRKSSLCPQHAKSSACQDGHAMNFYGQYTISPRDLGVGNLEELNFTTAVDCYKDIDSEKQLTIPTIQEMKPIGLFYGRSQEFAESPEPNMTAIILRAEVYGHGYYVLSLKMADGDQSNDQVAWKPRNDLYHEGDLSLLIYNLGAVYALEPGSDSLFATIPLNTTMIPTEDWAEQNLANRTEWNGQPLFKSRTQTVSVMCNTSYALCDHVNIPEEAGHCLDLGGWKQVQAFADRLQNNSAKDNKPASAREGFIYLLADTAHYSGMKESAEVVNGISANDLLQADFKIQHFLDQISGHRELTRLFLSTRTRFILAARRAVLNEWGERVVQMGFHANDIDRTMVGNPDLSVMCKATFIPDTNFKTTTARPWIITACIWLAIVLLTYSAPMIRKLQWSWVEGIEQSWASKRANKLHHQLASMNTADIGTDFKDLGSRSEQASSLPLLEQAEPFTPASQGKAQAGAEEATLIGTVVGGTETMECPSPRV
ncbi:hypothetical protein ONS95_010953 [Cadophora gregata]|uniref:uncharacterized protein n=1 Tax=Cadophora gregata TaxID=51156 RepID=UPI0026DB8177|nr:uncharacterized protein ONS95_010953 [Cadophora gregata]KAK0119508.1 hypothetical protein ONS95_010953 [Cadophora gregata]KAK0120553.1 hypothetical protein ONS96_014970 [Cadophora gregata f. sp. sojae]